MVPTHIRPFLHLFMYIRWYDKYICLILLMYLGLVIILTLRFFFKQYRSYPVFVSMTSIFEWLIKFYMFLGHVLHKITIQQALYFSFELLNCSTIQLPR